MSQTHQHGCFIVDNLTENERKNVFKKMQIIPTLFLKNNRAVVKNPQTGLYEDYGDPYELADQLSINTDMLLIDLDGIEHKATNNKNIIQKIAMKYNCYARTGGDFKEVVESYLNQNVRRIVVVPQDTDLINNVHYNRLIMRIRVNSKLQLLNSDVHGESILEFLNRMKNKVNFIIANIEHENNVNVDDINIEDVSSKLKELFIINKIEMRLAISFSFINVHHIHSLIKMNIIPVLKGNFFYGNNKITYGDIYSEIINYRKLKSFMNITYLNEHNNTILVPIMVIKEDDNTPLSLFHTTKEGIKQSIDTRKCIFYNKSTHSLYKASLNNNDLIKQVSINCDRTSILFVVAGGDFDSYINILNRFYWNKRLKGGMRDLYKIISNSVLYGGSASYTKKIAENKDLLLCKILEEANEVWCASNSSTDNLKYETSDLIYFLTIFCVSSGINIDDLYSELLRRHFNLRFSDSNTAINTKLVNNNNISELKLGMCISKYYQHNLFEFIKLNGLCIYKDNNSLKYNAHFENDNSITIKPFIIKPKDVYRFIENNLMDAVICYQDILDNYPCNYEHIVFPNINHNNECYSQFAVSRICVISNKDFDLNEYKVNPLKKLIIFSEYNYLTTKWIDSHGLNAKLVVVHGANEGHLINKLCDLIVCIVSTGKTIKDNGLVILDTIYESKIGLYVKKGYKQQIQNVIDKSKI